jgi:ribosomal protein S12 methylthiotransferase
VKHIEGQKKVFAISLGCPKNRVDTEGMLGILLQGGYALIDEPREADIVLVNTCAFIEDARMESLDTIKGLLKRMRHDATLVVAGCMVPEFEEEVRKVFRDALLIRPSEAGRISEFTLKGDVVESAFMPRLLTTEAGSAYLKVSEGCSRRCSFCIIPKLRGRQKSIPVAHITEEAKRLVATGAKEIVLVAQDLTHYGKDLPVKEDLAGLVESLSASDVGIHWLRLMYLYPKDIPEKLFDLVKERKNILPYFDIPVQHGDDSVLRAMRRGTTVGMLRELLAMVRRKTKGAWLRTTFMVGFPNETEEAFQNLLRFAKEAKFDAAGVFVFSREPLAYASKMDGQVRSGVARKRKKRLEALLGKIAQSKRLGLLGSVHEALIEGAGKDGSGYGRFWFQAPEVDGGVVVKRCRTKPGDFTFVRVDAFDGNDFFGTEVDYDGKD